MGTVEPCEMEISDGKTLDGLLYKPENLTPIKKYPVIIYFYEKYSDQIHTHYRAFSKPFHCEIFLYIPAMDI